MSLHSKERRPSKLLVVDPHPYAAEGLRVLLGNLTDDMEVAATATSPETIVDQVRLHSPDLLIIEPRLAGAMAAIKAVRSQYPDLKIVALTSEEDRLEATEVIRLGADAYLSKQIEPEELIVVLRVVRTGRMVVSRFATSVLLGGREDGTGTLGAQDRELLKLIIEGHDNGEIARKLAVSESTLKRNINLLLKKLDARNRIQAAVRAASNGLL